MPKDLLNRDNFGLLPEPEGRWGSFGISMVTNIIIMSLLILLTAAIHKVEKQKYNETLIFPQEVPPPPKIVVPKVKVFAPPQPEVVKLTPPKITIPKIQPPPEIPKPVELKLPGAAGKLAFTMAAEGFHQRGVATDHDMVVAEALAEVLSGGDADIVDVVNEDQLLTLERTAFMRLMKTAGTLARIEHLLVTGKPLRN